MTMRSGLIKDELAKAKRAVEEGLDKDAFAKAFNLMDSAADYWFNYFTPDSMLPDPGPPTPGGVVSGSGNVKAKLTPKVTKKED